MRATQMQFLKRRTPAWLFVGLYVFAVLLGVNETTGHSYQSPPSGAGPFAPLLKPVGLDERKVKLGKELFLDVRLSANDAVSCSSCHLLADGGDDGRAFSVGVSGNEGTMNSPTVYNLEGHVAYFWDGRAATLENQIDGPIHHKDELGISWDIAIKKLSAVPAYRNQFIRIYKEGITEYSIKDAIVTFQRTLVTNDSPFDEYLAGDTQALNANALNGLRLFSEFGCVSCHQGPLLGANLYQKIGVFHEYFIDPSTVRPADLGRFAITGNEEDKFYFKVPTLRNVALTAPYFHDGSVVTLDGAVSAMAYYQLGRSLSKKETEDLVAFLESLTSPTLAGFAQK